MAEEQKLSNFLETFNPATTVELKRVYRCPNCDSVVLEKVYFNTMHMCSCGAYTHAKNLKLEFERKW